MRVNMLTDTIFKTTQIVVVDCFVWHCSLFLPRVNDSQNPHSETILGNLAQKVILITIKNVNSRLAFFVKGRNTQVKIIALKQSEPI